MWRVLLYWLASFAHRAAGIPFQAHKLLCADGECCSHSDAGPWYPVSADPTRPPYTGMKRFRYHKWPNKLFCILTIAVDVRLIIFNKTSLHPLFHQPSLRIVSIDGGWESLSVHDPAPAGSRLFLSTSVHALLCVAPCLSLSLVSPLRSLCLLPCSPGGWGCHGLMHTQAEAFHTEKAFTGACTVVPEL